MSKQLTLFGHIAKPDYQKSVNSVYPTRFEVVLSILCLTLICFAHAYVHLKFCCPSCLVTFIDLVFFFAFEVVQPLLDSICLCSVHFQFPYYLCLNACDIKGGWIWP